MTRHSSVLQTPPESLSPMNYSATLYLFLQTLLVCGPGWPLSFRENEGDSNSIETPATKFHFCVSLFLAFHLS